MTATVVAALAGLLVCAGLWVTAGAAFDVEPLRRTNYRGEPVLTSVGLLVPVTLMVVVAAGHLALVVTRRSPVWDQLGRTSLLAAAAFGLLGLLDDVAGVGQSGGFRGHLRALARGELTSGSLKLFGGAAVGVLVAAAVASGDFGATSALRDGASVALAANAANLLDRAPGRAIKFSGVAFVGAVVVARSPTLAGPAVGVGAASALLAPDLRERIMLGDAGANPLGALVGLAWLVALPTPTGRWFLLLTLLVLNVASEVVSFSAMIDRVGPLRWFDRLGSLRA